jgi:hypothetical protein
VDKTVADEDGQYSLQYGVRCSTYTPTELKLKINLTGDPDRFLGILLRSIGDGDSDLEEGYRR